jgi:hypothetical protein
VNRLDVTSYPSTSPPAPGRQEGFPLPDSPDAIADASLIRRDVPHGYGSGEEIKYGKKLRCGERDDVGYHGNIRRVGS